MDQVSVAPTTRNEGSMEGREELQTYAFLPVKAPNKMCAVAEQAAFGPVAQEDEDEPE